MTFFAIFVVLGAIGWMMFQHLFLRFEPKVKRVLGFRLARALDDYGKEFMAVFAVADFHRDCENVWE